MKWNFCRLGQINSRNFARTTETNPKDDDATHVFTPHLSLAPFPYPFLYESSFLFRGTLIFGAHRSLFRLECNSSYNPPCFIFRDIVAFIAIDSTNPPFSLCYFLSSCILVSLLDPVATLKSSAAIVRNVLHSAYILFSKKLVISCYYLTFSSLLLHNLLYSSLFFIFFYKYFRNIQEHIFIHLLLFLISFSRIGFILLINYIIFFFLQCF